MCLAQGQADPGRRGMMAGSTGPQVPSHTFWADTRLTRGTHSAIPAQWETHGEVGATLGVCYPGHAGGAEGQSPLHCPARTAPSSWPAAPHSSWQPKRSSSSTDLTGSPTFSEPPKALGPIPTHIHSLASSSSPPRALAGEQRYPGIHHPAPHYQLHFSAQHCLMQSFHHHFYLREASETAVGLRPFPGTTGAPGTWQALSKY